MRALLPGRPQSTRQAVCTAQWDGLRLVAYVSGNTAVVLRGPKEIVQTISVDHVEALSAIAIDESSGRLALCDEKRALVFDAVGRSEGDLRWVQTRDIPAHENGTIRTLSWASSEELLIGGTQLWLYHVPHSEDARLIWWQSCANEVMIAQVSSDAEIIATCGHHDRLVKIWRRLSFELDSTRFDVSYLPHPATVTDLHWRKPWHAEQNLDNLLYTFCCDSQIRVWSYSDPHSLSLVQLLATIDTSTSIEPRRRSIGSVSRKRFAFILDSRDFSQATEKAIQQSQNQQVDHALEHLIEIANRSPEICVVLDGLGHMSVWGLENAGCKSKKPVVVFNVTLVDDVDMQLSFPHAEHDDYVQFGAFAGGTSPAALSVLVHSHTGQVDWYESSIAKFLDTSTRRDRLTLVSSWSGHDSTIDHIARGPSGRRILTWVNEGQAILWLQTESGALRRQCEVDTAGMIRSVVLLDTEEYLLVLQRHVISLWDLRHAYGQKVCAVSLGNSCDPRSIHRITCSSKIPATAHFSLVLGHGSHEIWQARVPPTPTRKQSAMTNGTHASLIKVTQSRPQLQIAGGMIACDVVWNAENDQTQKPFADLAVVNPDGRICGFGQFSSSSTDQGTWRRDVSVETNIHSHSLARMSPTGKCALVTGDGHRLYIWDLKKRTYEWRYEFQNPDKIQRIAWISSPGGHLLLFVCSSYHAAVIGQFRFSDSSKTRPAWHVLQNINLRDFSTIGIGDICWLSSGDIAIGAGNQVYVLESLATQDDLPTLRRGEEPTSRRPAMSVIDVANSVLPVFHADFLEALVVEGNQQVARKVLQSLYEKLKYFSEGDELFSDLALEPLDLASFMTDARSDSGVYTNGDTTVELEDVQTSFQDYLEKASIWQLGSEEHQKLSAVLETVTAIGKHSRSLDRNGLRYLHALYSTPEDQDLPWRAYVFASRSTSQEALLDLVSQSCAGKLTWTIARRTGLFVWLSDKAALQTQLENLARAEYTKHEDRNPVDCSLYYLALNKKPVLQGLWRMTIGVREKESTMRLLANNFDDSRWKATALKNAYALLSKRRFEYGAAFFLLAGSLKDAVNVCVNQLHDIQLAIAITRVWDKDVEQSEQVLEYLLEQRVLSSCVDSEHARWMAAWVYTTLNRPADALRVLVRPVHQIVAADLKSYNGPTESMSFRANDPHLVGLYSQIRDSLVKKDQWTTDVISQREEWDFILHAAMWWTRAGMDVLALSLTRNWKFVAHQRPRGSVAVTTMVTIGEAAKVEESEATKRQEEEKREEESEKKKKKPPPTQFFEPSADSLLDSFGF